MSKASRRRQRPGSPPSTARPAACAAESDRPSRRRAPGGSAVRQRRREAGRHRGVRRSTLPRAAPRRRVRPAARAVAGRRERQRLAYQPSFMERYRTADRRRGGLAGVALLVGVRVLVRLAAGVRLLDDLVAGADRVAGRRRDARPRLRPAGHGPPARRARREGDLHLLRAGVGQPLRPAGLAAPIAARVYGPNDSVIPQGWVHNLEHGGLVVLYQGTSAGATPEGQAQLRAFYEAFPPVRRRLRAGHRPVRPDGTPFQAIVWGRVLLLDTLDARAGHRLLEAVGRAHQPGEGRARRRTRRTSPSPAPSAAPSRRASPAPAPAVRARPRAVAAPSASPAASAAASPS